MAYRELQNYARQVAEALSATGRPYDYYVSGQGQGAQRFTPNAWRISSLPVQVRAIDTGRGSWESQHQEDQEIWLGTTGELFVMDFACDAVSTRTTTVSAVIADLTPEIARRPDRERSLILSSQGNWTFDEKGFKSALPFQGLMTLLNSVLRGNIPSGAASMGMLKSLDDIAGAKLFVPPPDIARDPMLRGAFENLQREASALTKELTARGWAYDTFLTTKPVVRKVGGFFGMGQREETTYELVPSDINGWRVSCRTVTVCLISDATNIHAATYYKQDDVEVWLLATGNLVEIEFHYDRASRGQRSVKADVRGPLTLATALSSDKHRWIKTDRERRGDTIRDWEWYDESEIRYSTPLTGIRLELAELRNGNRAVGKASEGRAG